MKTNYFIRVCTRHDVDAIYAILQKFPYPWKKEVLNDCFGEKYRQWALCDSSSTIIAFVIVYFAHDAWEIMQIAVDQQYQRKGFAAQLLRHVIQESRSNAIKKIQLEVRASNFAAIQLYQKLGFVQVGVRKNYYPCGDHREDALLFDF